MTPPIAMQQDEATTAARFNSDRDLLLRSDRLIAPSSAGAANTSLAPAAPELPPFSVSEGSSIRLRPPPLSGQGYCPGFYIPPPPHVLPPLSHSVTGGLAGSACGTSSAAFSPTCHSQYYRSAPYPHPQAQFTPAASYGNPTLGDLGNVTSSISPQQFSGIRGPSYSTFSTLLGGGYNRLPPMSMDSGLACRSPSRKRPRVDEHVVKADSNSAAKKTGAALNCLPTPPESDGSDGGSPHGDCPVAATALPGFTTPIPELLPLPPPLQNGVRVTLSPKCDELWRMFYALNTEMIVTKGGRCLFPLLIFTLSGLSRKKEYNVYVRAVCNDQYRYKYLSNRWTQVAESDCTHKKANMIVRHQNSPQSGAKWMAKDVDFKSLKITHSNKSKGGDILLNTMHKYFFEIVIEETESALKPLVFPFYLTRFVAVTAYQSAGLTELKKEKNPFARGVKHHDSETEARIVLHNQQQSLHHPHGFPQSPNLLPLGYSVPPYPVTTGAATGVSLLYPPGPIPYPTPWSQPPDLPSSTSVLTNTCWSQPPPLPASDTNDLASGFPNFGFK